MTRHLLRGDLAGSWCAKQVRGEVTVCYSVQSVHYGCCERLCTLTPGGHSSKLHLTCHLGICLRRVRKVQALLVGLVLQAGPISIYRNSKQAIHLTAQ